jgi:hypothetical protein
MSFHRCSPFQKNTGSWLMKLEVEVDLEDLDETLDDLDEPDSLLDIIDVEVENIDSILDSLLDDDDGHFDLWD